MALEVRNASKIFGTPDQLLKESGKLVRLSRIDEVLPKQIKQREAKRRAISQVFVNAVSQNPPKEQVQKELTNLRVARAFPQDPSMEDRKWIKRAVKDVACLSISPVQRSKKGLNGPTLLVSYSEEKNNRDVQLEEYVIKWVKPDEIPSNRIYSVFQANQLFLIPAVGGVNFHNNIHESMTCECTVMDLAQNEQLKKNFLELAKSYASLDEDEGPTENQVMVAERVCGANVVDFALTKYEYLNPKQKEDFFKRLGALALLDLLIGNSDRLAKAEKSFKTGAYELSDLESNLGNVMIEWRDIKQDEPIVYAIDNGMDPDLYLNPGEQEKYLLFLKTLFSSPNWSVQIGKSIAKSMQSALRMQADDESSANVEEMKAKFALLSQDLDGMAVDALIAGVEEMAQKLESSLLPKWESDECMTVRQSLRSTAPNLLSGVQTRFETFQKTRKST